MSTVFLANLGVRDLQLDGQCLSRPRDDGAGLLAQWPAVAGRLSLPIIEPSLRHLRERDSMPDRVLLFATDQSDTVPPKYRDQDTLHCAELAKRLIEKRLGLDGRVTVRGIAYQNPALYDEMYRFFSTMIGNPGDKAFQGVHHCYVSPVGGTPAANTGLLLAAVDRFGKACTVLYLREGTDTPVHLDMGRLLYLNTLREIAAQQVESYQFAPSLPLLKEMELPSEPCCAELAEYCQRRLNFDFEGARRLAEDAYTRARPDIRGLLDEAASEARRLDEATDAGPLLVELARNMGVVYDHGGYLDYLTRVVRFEEAAARHIVEMHLPPLSYARNDYKAQETRERQIGGMPDLLEYLTAASDGGQPLRYELSNTRVLLRLVDYLVRERPSRPPDLELPAPRRQALAEAQQILRWLEGLNTSRNASMHQFGGASAERIAATYAESAKQPRNVQDDIWRVVELVVGPMTDEWLVGRIRDRIIAELHR